VFTTQICVHKCAREETASSQPYQSLKAQKSGKGSYWELTK
jgi:hypothetical protein